MGVFALAAVACCAFCIGGIVQFAEKRTGYETRATVLGPEVDIPLAEIDSMFDSIFAPSADEPVGNARSPHAQNPVRLYGSNEDM